MQRGEKWLGGRSGSQPYILNTLLPLPQAMLFLPLRQYQPVDFIL